MPLAGALIAVALLSRSLRPAVAGSAGDVRAMGRAMGSAFGARYAHRSAAGVPGRWARVACACVRPGPMLCTGSDDPRHGLALARLGSPL